MVTAHFILFAVNTPENEKIIIPTFCKTNMTLVSRIGLLFHKLRCKLDYSISSLTTRSFHVKSLQIGTVCCSAISTNFHFFFLLCAEFHNFSKVRNFIPFFELILAKLSCLEIIRSNGKITFSVNTINELIVKTL